MLHEVKNDTNGKGYCGPTAIASITGKRLSVVLDEFRKVRGWDGWGRKRRIGGTSRWECLQVLRRFGWYNTDRLYFDDRPTKERPTLTSFFKVRDPKVTYLVEVSNHWIAVAGRKMCDTYTKGVPTFIGKAPHRRKRVAMVYGLTKLAK
jgi:hypothetical protein